jgi:hypothetical protein
MTERRKDRRYGSARWRRLSDRTLGKTKTQRQPIYQCYAEGCYRIGDRADHIWPTSPATPDAEFYNPAGLRPACWAHNRARAFGLEFDEPTAERPRSRLTVPFGKPPRVW